MYKLVVLTCFLALAFAEPSHIHDYGLKSALIHEPAVIPIHEHTIEQVGAHVKSIPAAVSHQSQTIYHSEPSKVTPILAPAVQTHYEPAVRTYEKQYIENVPVVQQYAAPIAVHHAPAIVESSGYGSQAYGSYAARYAAPAVVKSLATPALVHSHVAPIAHVHTHAAGANVHAYAAPAHTHAYVAPAHVQTYAAPAHAHTYAAPAHVHAYTAPVHAHAYAAPAHVHSYAAPAHVHGYVAPAHAHAYAAPAHLQTYAAPAVVKSIAAPSYHHSYTAPVIAAPVIAAHAYSAPAHVQTYAAAAPIINAPYDAASYVKNHHAHIAKSSW